MSNISKPPVGPSGSQSLPSVKPPTDEDCYICHHPYNDRDHVAVERPPCNHVFGQPCILRWLESSRGENCPLCCGHFFPKPETQDRRGRVRLSRSVPHNEALKGTDCAVVYYSLRVPSVSRPQIPTGKTALNLMLYLQ